jgi:alpha-D-xyloside xylohydrolase
MPYIYTLAGQTYHDNYTIMRPLIMDHASDANVLNIKDEFMFGPNMLICPVYEYEKRSREIYLPGTSDWYDLYTGALYEGGKTYDIDAPLSKIPVFVPQGAIIPIGPEIQYTDELPADTIALCIFGGKNGAFELYEDEGTNTNYENGQFRKIPIVYNDETGNLMIGKAFGSYSGMTEKICFVIKLYKPQSGKSPNIFSTSGMKITYDGNPITLNIL